MGYANHDDQIANGKRYYAANKDKWKNPNGSWKVANITVERRREVSNKSYAKNKDKIQAKAKAKRDAERVIGDCPTCKDFHGQLSWDHNHFTGEFRAYICQGCNLTIGHAKESPTTLKIGRA